MKMIHESNIQEPSSKKSENYDQVREHYRKLLSEHYTWTFGGAQGKQALNYNILSPLLETCSNRNNQIESSQEYDNSKKRSRMALDLGCGSGFQTIPLLKMGHHVVAIDACDSLLEEVSHEIEEYGIDTSRANLIVGDLLLFPQLLNSVITDQPVAFDIIVCMGDTLTHLASLKEVKNLMQLCYQYLHHGGRAIFQFRDLTTPLHGVDRFIPVRSDERTVFTCFLEWPNPSNTPDHDLDYPDDGSGIHVTVHDLVHVKKGIGAWELCKSTYQKLALSGEYVKRVAERIGFQVQLNPLDTDMVLVVLDKSPESS